MVECNSKFFGASPKTYNAPSLVVYGSVAKLTAGAAGSVFESVAGNSGSKTKPG